MTNEIKNIKILTEEIEKNRTYLYYMVENKKGDLKNEEIIKISKKIDSLLTKYMEASELIRKSNE
ncbi:MAG: aspartyl-phosphate phosphatase Spo0E family protein [Thermoanaerobacteraceae bacterium]